MKRIILILAAILVIVCIGLYLFSKNDEYYAEKLLFQAGKERAEINANPDVAVPAMIASVENKLKEILDRYPKTEAAKIAEMGLIEHYIQYKEYDKALAGTDNVILKASSEDLNLLSSMHFLKGNIYQQQNKFDEALAEYIMVKYKYPDTRMGLQMPIYIANYYKEAGETTQAQAAYAEAALLYKDKADKAKGEVMGYVMSTLLTQVYANTERYEEAAAAIEDILNTYPAPFTYMQHLPNVDFIIIRKLNQPERALKIYKSVREKVGENNKMSQILDEKIKELEAARNDGTTAADTAPVSVKDESSSETTKINTP